MRIKITIWGVLLISTMALTAVAGVPAPDAQIAAAVLAAPADLREGAARPRLQPGGKSGHAS